MGEINLFVASNHLNQQFCKMIHCFKVLETLKKMHPPPPPQKKPSGLNMHKSFLQPKCFNESITNSQRPLLMNIIKYECLYVFFY